MLRAASIGCLTLALALGRAAAGPVSVEQVRVVRTRAGLDLLAVASHGGRGERVGMSFWSVTTERGERLRVVSPRRSFVGSEAIETWMKDLRLPPGTRRLTLRFHDLVHGYEGHEPFVIDLDTPKGERYEIVEEDKPLPYRRFHGGRVRRDMLLLGKYVPYLW